MFRRGAVLDNLNHSKKPQLALGLAGELRARGAIRPVRPGQRSLEGKRVGIPVLLAATATRWAGPACLPRELVGAGFDVSVLAPRGALVAESRHVAAVSHLPEGAAPMQWAYTLAASIGEPPPRLIVPCDDMTLHLMMSFVESPPEGLSEPLRARIVALLRESLCDPKYYR